MNASALLYLSMGLGFLILLAIVGWLFVKHLSKKHNLDD